MTDNADGKFDVNSYYFLFIWSNLCSIRDCYETWVRLGVLRGNEENAKLDTEGIERQLLAMELSVQLDLLPGESLLRTFLTTKYKFGIGRTAKSTEEGFSLAGNIYFTNYRILFCRCSPSNLNTFEDRYSVPKYFDKISIPLGSIQKAFMNNNKSVTLETKDARSVTINFTELLHILDSDAHQHTPQGFVGLIENYCSMDNQSEKDSIFAFKYISLFRADGWKLNTIVSEYIRLGLAGSNDSDWKVRSY